MSASKPVRSRFSISFSGLRAKLQKVRSKVRQKARVKHAFEQRLIQIQSLMARYSLPKISISQKLLSNPNGLKKFRETVRQAVQVQKEFAEKLNEVDQAKKDLDRMHRTPHASLLDSLLNIEHTNLSLEQEWKMRALHNRLRRLSENPGAVFDRLENDRLYYPQIRNALAANQKEWNRIQGFLRKKYFVQ